jgi:hypothetical protein
VAYRGAYTLGNQKENRRNLRRQKLAEKDTLKKICTLAQFQGLVPVFDGEGKSDLL